MKNIKHYQEFSKYNQDKLKYKLFLIYIILFLVIGFFFLMGYYSFNPEKHVYYVPQKIENGKLNYEKENVNIINNGTANITINNYYGDTIIKKEKKEYLFKIYSSDVIVLNDLFKKAIFNLDKYKDNKNCKAYTNANSIINNRTSFSLEHISCENGFSEKINGYILGEDAKRDVLLEKKIIEKDILLGIMNGFILLNNELEDFNSNINLNDENLKNIYIISKNRKFDLIISEELLGQCGGDYKFKNGECIRELIEDIQN